MIPYTELERAIARWKVRQSGGVEPAAPVELPAHEVSAGARAQSDRAEYHEVDDAYAEVSAEQVETVAVEPVPIEPVAVEEVPVENSGYVRFENNPPPVDKTPTPPPPQSRRGRRRRNT